MLGRIKGYAIVHLSARNTNHHHTMTNTEIQQFVENNAQLIADKVNDYTAACNIKFSEFNEEQQRKLKVTLGAIEIQKLTA